MKEYNAWMERVDGSTYISELSIPGTHNSGAFFKISAPSVKCQGESIEDQLQNGVRFLDIRLSKDYMARGANVDDLIIVHGKFPVKLSGSYKFKKLLQSVYKFLEKNPSETVLLSLKQEGAMLNWDHANDEFPKVLFQKYIGHDRKMWHLSNKIPILDKCRGKVVLLRRFGVKPEGVYKNFGLPTLWSHNADYHENVNCCVQDFCEIKNQSDISTKMNLIRDMFYRAQKHHYNNRPPKLFINFCSGAYIFNRSCWPSGVEKEIRKYKIDKYYSKSCGVVVLDFADREHWNLVKGLVDANFT